MRRTFTAGALGLLLLTPGVPAIAEDHGSDPTEPLGPAVVAEGLNNPRQITQDEDGDLVVAEAGRGTEEGQECRPVAGHVEEGEGEGEGPEAPPTCVGLTGAVTEIEFEEDGSYVQERVLSGLPSAALPSGAFATGTNGADEIEDDFFVLAQSPGFGILDEDDEDGEGGEDGEVPDVHEDNRQGVYVAAPERPEEVPGDVPIPGLIDLENGGVALLAANLAEAEARLNPGGNQVESNPYAVVFVTEDPDNDEDGFALVADAGANAVWKVGPADEGQVEDENTIISETVPGERLAVEVFASFPDRPDIPADVDTDEEFQEFFESNTEFVPTSIALDDFGHVFVGGLGSDVPGAAEVVKYDLDANEIRRWTGFTAVTGVAVDGDHLYVSQLFGNAPEMDNPEPPTEAPGSVVRTSRHVTDGERDEVMVPFPAGLATDGSGGVFVAANSVAPSGGVTDVFGPGSFAIEGGQVWFLDAALFTQELPEQPEMQWPPADTNGEFVPLPSLPPETIEACDTEITISQGDVDAFEYRSTVVDSPQGQTTVVEIRGDATVDVTRASDGAVVDELDVGGDGLEVYGPNTFQFVYEGPSLLFSHIPAEAEALERAGLPDPAYYTGGVVSAVGVLGPQAEGAMEPNLLFAEVVDNSATGVVSLCDLFEPIVTVSPTSITAVDPANNRVSLHSGAVVTYDENDEFSASETGGPVTQVDMAKFEASLQVGRRLDGVQVLDPAGVSQLHVTGLDHTPLPGPAEEDMHSHA